MIEVKEVKESKPSNDEIVEALKVIKQECSSGTLCLYCRLSFNGKCMFSQSDPCEWNINSPEETTWKAFKG